VIVIAAVPIKDLVNAKQRLMPVLTPAQRAALARAMLEDVLRALCGAPLREGSVPRREGTAPLHEGSMQIRQGSAPLRDICVTIRDVYVVTRDPDVAAIVRQFPCTVLEEPANRGHTEAVAFAQEAAARAGAEAFLTVPGDVPCVTSSEIRAMLEAARGDRSALFVPSASGHGTNGVVLRPPDVMALKFGEPSFANHLTAARRRGLEPAILQLRGLALDIDGPEDLQALRERGAGTASGRLVAAWLARDTSDASARAQHAVTASARARNTSDESVPTQHASAPSAGARDTSNATAQGQSAPHEDG
jgi:2-phospho-L-lactate/phosphoenolpyruvate guanylyltransferase